MRKGIQCKHLDEFRILGLLFFVEVKLNFVGGTQWPGFENSIPNVVPPGTPPGVIRRKLQKMKRRGLINGCLCGCRGDFTLTDKGKEVLFQISITDE